MKLNQRRTLESLVQADMMKSEILRSSMAVLEELRVSYLALVMLLSEISDKTHDEISESIGEKRIGIIAADFLQRGLSVLAPSVDMENTCPRPSYSSGTVNPKE